MSETYELKAEARERAGKGSARDIRRNGKVPAVIYGGKEAPVSITLPYKELTKRIHAGGFLTTVATIDVAGKKVRVLPKDYQLDPVRDFTMHVDFLRVTKDTVVTVEVPVHFENEEAAPGLKQGGVLNIVRHTIEVSCPADAIPDSFTIDLTGLEIGDSVHASALTIPENVELTITDRDFTIATIATPVEEVEDEPVDAEEAEGDEAAADEDGAEGEADSDGEDDGEKK